MEVLGEEETCVALEEVLMEAHSRGLRARLHYVALVEEHPEENQRLSGLMRWVGLEEGGSWKLKKDDYIAVEIRRYIYFSDYATKTYL